LIIEGCRCDAWILTVGRYLTLP